VKAIVILLEIINELIRKLLTRLGISESGFEIANPNLLFVANLRKYPLQLLGFDYLKRANSRFCYVCRWRQSDISL